MAALFESRYHTGFLPFLIDARLAEKTNEFIAKEIFSAYFEEAASLSCF